MLDQTLVDYINKGDYSASLSLFQENKNLQMNVNEALVHYLFGKIGESRQLATKSLEQSVLQGLWKTEYCSSILLANIAMDCEEQQQFEDLFEQAELLQTLNNTSELENSSIWSSLYNKIQAIVYQNQAQGDKAIAAITNAVSLGKETGIVKLFQNLQFQAADYLAQDSQYNLALSYYHELLVNKNDIPGSLLQHIYEGLGDIHFKKGDLNLSLFYLEKIVEIYKEEDKTQALAESLQKIATIYLSKAKYEKAVEHLHQSQELHKGRGDLKGTTWSEFQLAITRYRQGFWDEALVSFNRCTGIFEQIGDALLVALTKKFIGDIFRLQGDFQEAKSNFLKAIELLANINDKWNLANVYNKLGMVLVQQQQYQEAHQNFQKSLAIYTKIGDKIRSSDPIFNLIRIKLELGAETQAKFFLDMLRDIRSRTGDQLVQLKHTMAEALVLKHQGRIIQKASAQKILQEVVNQPMIDSELSILAMVNLCDLLLAELHLYQNPIVLEEILDLSVKLAGIALEQKSYQMQVDVLILQAKLSLISGEAELSLENLNKAEQIASEHGLSKLLDIVKMEIDAVSTQLRQWEGLTTKHASIREKMEMANIESYIDSLVS